MKRFRYQLEPLLRLREWELQGEQAAVGDIGARQHIQQEAIDALQAKQNQATQSWETLHGADQVLSVDQLRRNTLYCADLAVRLSAEQAAMDELAQERDVLVQRMLHSQRQVDGFEDHRDQMKNDFLRARTSGEFKQADDQWNTLSARDGDDEYSA
jgi:flagellar biosynthesis chaperone FliJ